MNVLSLFDGISVGHLALKEVGINVENYYASEINKNSIKITQYHFPNTIQLGDVCNWREWNIPWDKIDMLIGGSPCFKAGTQVYTKDGYKNIEDIKVNDLVLTHLNRWRKVLSVGSTENKNLWKIKTCNGFKFYATANHPFWSAVVLKNKFSKHSFKAVEELSNSDYLISLKKKDGSENCEYEYDLICSVEKTDRITTVYNIEVEEDHTYIVNEKIVHNCQNISFSGDKRGLDGEKSSLFYVYRDILNYLKEINPNILFLLENVKGKADVLNTITKELGVKPVRINSSLVSAQRRDRYYWTNIHNGEIEQPEDKGIVLSDILREEDDGKYPLSVKHYNAFLKSYPNWSESDRSGKSKPLLASYYKQPPHCPYIKDEKSESGYRRLSPIECERCQTLPDDYTNVDNMCYKNRTEAVGNSWTLKVISHIFSYI